MWQQREVTRLLHNLLSDTHSERQIAVCQTLSADTLPPHSLCTGTNWLLKKHFLSFEFFRPSDARGQSRVRNEVWRLFFRWWKTRCLALCVSAWFNLCVIKIKTKSRKADAPLARGPSVPSNAINLIGMCFVYWFIFLSNLYLTNRCVNVMSFHIVRHNAIFQPSTCSSHSHSQLAYVEMNKYSWRRHYYHLLHG